VSKASFPNVVVTGFCPEKRCYACDNPDAPKQVKIDGFTESVCLADYARHRRGEVLMPFGCEPVTIEAHPLTEEQVERDLAALKAESDAEMAAAARASAAFVEAIEASEARHARRERSRVARLPIAEPKQKPAPVVNAAPIQVVDVVAVVPVVGPAPVPVAKDWRTRPQNQPKPFDLRPEAERRPDLCRRAGCTRKPKARDLCDACHTTACERKILHLVGAPIRPVSERDTTRDQSNSILARVEAIAKEKPGIHADDISAALGINRRQVVRAILALRKHQRLARSKTTRNDPKHLCAYPPSSPKVVHTRTVRKP